jgi:hypothetical protein
MPYNDCQQQQQLRDVGLGRKANWDCGTV